MFGEARTYRLAKSGLGLQAGIKWFHNADPRLDSVEGRGSLPDLWIDSEHSPAIAEKLALCLAEAACARRLGVGSRTPASPASASRATQGIEHFLQ